MKRFYSHQPSLLLWFVFCNSRNDQQQKSCPPSILTFTQTLLHLKVVTTIFLFSPFLLKNPSPSSHPIYQLIQERNLLNTFKISHKKFVHCIMTLEEHYLNVPYHNCIHAADVTQSVHVLLLSSALEVSMNVYDYELKKHKHTYTHIHTNIYTIDHKTRKKIIFLPPNYLQFGMLVH